jgi:hypothetical protein
VSKYNPKKHDYDQDGDVTYLDDKWAVKDYNQDGKVTDKEEVRFNKERDETNTEYVYEGDKLVKTKVTGSGIELPDEPQADFSQYSDRFLKKHPQVKKLIDKDLDKTNAKAIALDITIIQRELDMLEGKRNEFDKSLNELIAKKIEKVFDMRPYFIEERFKLRTPIYSETAAYGHMGRESKVVEKIFNKGKKSEKRVKVELFPWEKLDYVEQLKKAFKI